MHKLTANNIELLIDTQGGAIASLLLGKKEMLVCPCPLFVMRLRTRAAECLYIDSTMAKNVRAEGDRLIYSCFGNHLAGLTATVTVTGGDCVRWQIAVEGIEDRYALEWVEFPKICAPQLIDNNAKGGKILFPYDEGIIVTNEKLLPRYEPEFPMSGAHFIFPNKLCAQFMAYLFDGVGLYIGAHDPKRSFKGLDFCPQDGGITLQVRLYSGVDFGQSFKTDYPIVWQACTGDWRVATEIYRAWFECNLPPRVTTIKENKALPSWYKESPLIVTYPVRGIHDMDKMEPNELFPYTNALPILNKFKAATGCRIMALLMHWEGTAPWAPPYVWPPFGGVELFNEFRDALHKSGDLLGVYCSGFGYTKQSTLIESYNCEQRIEKENVLRGVCHSPANKPELGITCSPYQRYGYDICPVSKRGRELLDDAYAPVFESGIDYAQILDQNHGGGQYMCYGRDHGHPPMPGEWMTSAMQRLLTQWNKNAPNMLFGCESAAAEPFIGNLLMSDNRFELNYAYGTPVPIYAFIYHQYVRNFMGNQCGCPFEPKCDTLRYRLAYSFSIGDIMTLIISPKGTLMSHWGTHDRESAPNMEKALLFIKNMREFYDNQAKEYLCYGKMCVAPEIECEKIKIPQFRGQELSVLPRLLCSSWEAQKGKTAYIVVNPEDVPVSFRLGQENYTVEPLNALLIIKDN